MQISKDSCDFPLACHLNAQFAPMGQHTSEIESEKQNVNCPGTKPLEDPTLGRAGEGERALIPEAGSDA